MRDLAREWRRYGRIVFDREFARWLWTQIWLDDIGDRAAQLSFYFLLSLFPLLICVSALLGYFFAAETALERRLLEYLGALMPRTAFDIVMATANDLLVTRSGGKVSIGLLLSLWLAASGTEAVIEGLNVAFQVREARPWWKRRLVALGLTIAAAVLTGCAAGLALAGGAGQRFLAEVLGLRDWLSPIWRAAQWLASLCFLLLSITLIYSLGPNLKARRKDQVVVPGAIFAMTGWIAASAAFRFYLDRFSTFGVTYGSLGAVIALLLWLYMTGAVLLLGAVVNTGIQARLDNS